MDEAINNENIEIDLLLEAIFRKYGYDFRNYAKASVRRRMRQRQRRSGFQDISQMQHHVLNDVNFFETLLQDLTINVTEMFRDPHFFKALRNTILPQLAERPFVKIWHAGCATGEEAYSMAIFLKETGLDKQSRIYATDANEVVLEKAKKGIFSRESIDTCEKNYLSAGGSAQLSDYFTYKYGHAIVDLSLRDQIIFSDHNLVTDGVFGEMDLIMCRNVLIYFSSELQERVIRLFVESLSPDGFLCLGTKESLRFTASAGAFEKVLAKEKIYKKRALE